MKTILQTKKLFVFDLDGTLIDSINIWHQVDNDMIARYGTNEVDKESISQERDRVLKEVCMLTDPYLAYCRYLVERYAMNIEPEELKRIRYEIANDYLRNKVDFKEGAVEFLNYLYAQGHTLVIASTTSRANIDIYRTQNERMMSKLNFDKIFAAIYTRDDVNKIKPSPEVYERVLSDFACDKSDCIIFEDSLVGIDAACSAGVEVISLYDSYAMHDINEIKSKSIRHYNNCRMMLLELTE